MTHKAQGLTLDDWPHVKRWFATVRARDAVQRGLAVGKDLRQAAAGGMDDETRKNLFGAPAAPAGPGESQP
jgi:GST-like protein